MMVTPQQLSAAGQSLGDTAPTPTEPGDNAAISFAALLAKRAETWDAASFDNCRPSPAAATGLSDAYSDYASVGGSAFGEPAQADQGREPAPAPLRNVEPPPARIINDPIFSRIVTKAFTNQPENEIRFSSAIHPQGAPLAHGSESNAADSAAPPQFGPSEEPKRAVMPPVAAPVRGATKPLTVSVPLTAIVEDGSRALPLAIVVPHATVADGRATAAPAATAFIAASMFGHTPTAMQPLRVEPAGYAQLPSWPNGTRADRLSSDSLLRAAFDRSSTAHDEEPCPVSAATGSSGSTPPDDGQSRPGSLPIAAALPAEPETDPTPIPRDALISLSDRTAGTVFSPVTSPTQVIQPAVSHRPSLSISPSYAQTATVSANATYSERTSHTRTHMRQRWADAAAQTLPLRVTAYLGSDGVQIMARIKGIGEAEFERMTLRMLAQADVSVAGLIINGRRVGSASRR